MLLIEWGETIRHWTLFGLPWLEFIGVAVTVFVLVYFLPLYLCDAFRIWVAPVLRLNTDLKKMGAWAVITGASEGIGKAYAQELARLGLNVVLISRSVDKLMQVANNIENTCHVQTKVIVADFTQGPEVYQKIKGLLANLEIGVLINNVGMCYYYPKYFLEIDEDDTFIEDIIHCNVLAMTKMTRLILPQMVARKKGVVVNISSLAGTFVAPLFTLYVATKSYVDRFTMSLALEYEKDGIIIQSVLPGWVCSNLSRISAPSFVCPTPTTYVQKAIKTIGLEQRTAVHMLHRLSILFFKYFFFFFPELAARFNMQAFLGIRKSLQK